MEFYILFQFDKSQYCLENFCIVRNYLMIKLAITNGSRLGMLCWARVIRARNPLSNSTGKYFMVGDICNAIAKVVRCGLQLYNY